MGCDIHASIEVQKYSWDSVITDLNINRDYELFSILAGVRGSESPISEPRGVPSNASFQFTDWLERYGSDAHSMSYVSFKELKEHAKDYSNEKFYQIMELYAKDYGDDKVRLMFFFDN